MIRNDRFMRGLARRWRRAALAFAALALLAGAGPAQAGGDDGALQWGESYAGLFVGLGEAQNRIVDVEGFANWGEPGWAVEHDASSPVGGVLFGKSLALGNVPLRLEIDGTIGGNGLAASANTLDPEGLDETVETSFGWIASARVGLDEVLGPARVFVSAGIAAARIDRSVTDIDTPDDGTPPYVDDDDSFSDDSTEIGWVISVGQETTLSDGWTLRLEGTYMDFGSSTHRVNHSGNNRCGPEGPLRPCLYETEHALGVVRVALIHRFGL